MLLETINLNQTADFALTTSNKLGKVLVFAHTLPSPRQQAWGLVGMQGFGWGTPNALRMRIFCVIVVTLTVCPWRYVDVRRGYNSVAGGWPALLCPSLMIG